MDKISEMVLKELRIATKSRRALELCGDIFSWYEDGGDSLVKDRIDDRVKKISQTFKREAEDIKIVAKLKRPRKRKR